jgi:hypothetical protein
MDIVQKVNYCINIFMFYLPHYLKIPIRLGERVYNTAILTNVSLVHIGL